MARLGDQSIQELIGFYSNIYHLTGVRAGADSDNPADIFDQATVFASRLFPGSPF